MTKRSVSESALFRRCQRRLYRVHRLHLHRCRYRSNWFESLGRYYMVDERNHIAGYHGLTLDELARELNVIAADEELVE